MLELTQQQLADLVGVTRNAVADWERGKSGPTALHLALVGRALGSPPWELYDVVDQDGGLVDRPWVRRR